MPVKPNRTDLQNYVPPGNEDGGEYASGTAERGSIPKEKYKETTIPYKDKVKQAKEKLLGRAAGQPIPQPTAQEPKDQERPIQQTTQTVIQSPSAVERPKRLETTAEKLEYIKKHSKLKVDLTSVAKGKQQDEIITSLYEHYEDFPELRDKLTYVGGIVEFVKEHVKTFTDAFMKANGNKYPRAAVEKATAKKLRSPLQQVKGQGKTIMFAMRDNQLNLFDAIVINSAYSKDSMREANMRYAESVGFHPPGTASTKAKMDHEIGHKLDDLYKISSMPEIEKLYMDTDQKVRRLQVNREYGATRDKMKSDALSIYGFKNMKEFVAEGWCEYRNNPNPRPIAMAIGRAIENARKQNFGK